VHNQFLEWANSDHVRRALTARVSKQP
jgi:hypothetical protein